MGSEKNSRENMRLDEIKKTKQLGTYAGVRFTKDTVAALQKYIEDNEIPHPENDFHATLLYSRKHLPKYFPINYDPPMPGKFKELKMLGPNKNALVISFDAPELEKRHKELRKEHNADWDFDSFIPHVTLSFDIEDIDVDELPDPKFSIKMEKEYSEEINED